MPDGGTGMRLAANGLLAQILDRLENGPHSGEPVRKWIEETAGLLGKAADRFWKAGRKYHSHVAMLVQDAILKASGGNLSASQAAVAAVVCRLLRRSMLTRDDAILADRTLREAGLDWLP